MQQYGDYTFDADGTADYSNLGKPALFTPKQFIGAVIFAAGVAAVLVAVLVVLLS